MGTLSHGSRTIGPAKPRSWIFLVMQDLIRQPGSRFTALLVFCFYIWAGAVAAADYNLPQLGEPANAALSPAEEERLGARVVAQLLQGNHILEDTELQAYLRQVGQQLLQASDRDASDFHFFAVRDGSINAFALPGGHIGVNTGLLTETDSESELAGVMAHEIAHVTQRHIARQFQATKGTQWASLAALLAAALLSGGDGDVMEAAITGSISMSHQQSLGFTRAHEAEADHVGIRRLAAAHFDPNAMATFFGKLQRRSRLYGQQPPQILLSHPVTTTRIAEARARAEDYPALRVRESTDYALMKERARVLATAQYGELLRYYRNVGAPDNGNPADTYGYALTLMRSGAASQAVELLQALAQEHAEQFHYVTALAEAQKMAGQPQAAEATLQQALSRFGDKPALVLQYAGLLLANNQPQAARALLKRHPSLVASNDRAQEILAEAAGKQDRLGEAYYHQAQ